jgi:predicted AlkP superfamily phosphohydrolase/phosphomutase
MTQEPSDFTAIVFDGVDKIQHLAYRFLDPALLPPEPTEWEREILALCRSYYRQVDDFLGRAIRRAGRWARVFVASDHGFTATREVVYINKWLHDRGYLTWRERPEEDACNAVFAARLADLCNAIDLPQTRAYALTPSCNGIYIDNVPAAEYPAFRENLIRELFTLRGPDGGQVITEIKKREEWFPGPFSERVPDLTLTLRDFGLISVLNSHAVVVPRQEPAGTHHPHGVLLGTGPGLHAGRQVDLVSILDVAPLLLHSLGMEIPASMEGTFPGGLYESDYLASDPPRIGSPAPVVVEPAPTLDADLDEAGEQILMERLKSLGYIE